MNIVSFNNGMPRQPERKPDLAEMAVAIRLAQLELPEIAFSLMVQSMLAHAGAQSVEVLAARIGLSTNVAERIISDKGRHSELLGEAFAVIRWLMDMEDSKQ